MVNILLEHRADVANIDQNGFNALDLAIENGHRYVTLPLLQVETLTVSGLLTVSLVSREGPGDEANLLCAHPGYLGAGSLVWHIVTINLIMCEWTNVDQEIFT